MKEKEFIGYIPKKEQEYLMRLSESDSPYISDLSEDGKLKSEGEYTKHTFFVSYLCNLQHLVGIYSKTVDAFMDIDMELYPELYETQEKACDLIAKAYYEEKDSYHDFLGHLDIYNPDIEGMSSRNGMISIY